MLPFSAPNREIVLCLHIKGESRWNSSILEPRYLVLFDKTGLTPSVWSDASLFSPAHRRKYISDGTAKKSAPARDVDDYLAALPHEARATLEKLRKTIKAAEIIS